MKVISAQITVEKQIAKAVENVDGEALYSRRTLSMAMSITIQVISMNKCIFVLRELWQEES